MNLFKKNNKFKFSIEEKVAFETLKELLAKGPANAYGRKQVRPGGYFAAARW